MKRPIWILLLCAGTILGLSLGFRQAIGLFLPPMMEDLKFGRESFALGMGLMNLVWGFGAPVAGAIADKYGAARVAASGGALYAAGLVVFSQTGSPTELAIGGTLIGFGLSGSGFSVVLGTVGRLVSPKDRSQALGLVAAGGSLGQFLALPYTHMLIGSYGWVLAFILIALTMSLSVPLAASLRLSPGEQQAHTTEPTDNQRLGSALRQASRVPSFWLLNLGFSVCGFHLAFVAVHLPAYLTDEGFRPWLAAAALTAVGFSNIVGSYVCGMLGAFYSKKKLLSALYLARALIFFLFITTPVTETSVLIFSAAIGFLWLGTVPLTSELVGNLFGTRYLSMLLGIVFLGHQVGGFLGVWLAGEAYVAFGSYDLIWWICVALGLVSAALHWPIDERRREDSEVAVV